LKNVDLGFKFLKNIISKTCRQRDGLHDSAINAIQLYCLLQYLLILNNFLSFLDVFENF